MILQPFTLSRRPAGQHGIAVVEFALILILLISLLAGIFEFGRAFWYYDALTKAARDGARLMSVSDKATISSAGVQAAKDAVVFAVADPNKGAGVPDFTTANVDVTCLDAAFNPGPACADGTAPGGVRVQINYPMTIGQFIPFLIGASTSYSATLAPHTTMRYMPADAP
jgi:Flp pilus assembly protein TadG